MTLYLESRLKCVLEERGSTCEKPSPCIDISDITESPGYHKLPLNPRDITVTFNTDGVPLFESSGYGMWPLLLHVSDLSYKDRMSKEILAS
ncbi:hypothetical protein HPB50_011310 [Hyalomma asiaticum]|uniref:Uncharacterized protein n=1 Tax=Hyalomma asiaticum TaxID=266040 RepID=A0ACB7RWT9_HYAAI|nr:hypothetical protein HPB50_011310 [Hyalomma asiaticum]